MPDPNPTAWSARHLLALVGMVLLLGTLPFYLFISLIAPSWMVVPAVLVWCVGLVLALRWFRPRPARTLAVGVGAVVLWFLAGYVGEAVFGWTA